MAYHPSAFCDRRRRAAAFICGHWACRELIDCAVVCLVRRRGQPFPDDEHSRTFEWGDAVGNNNHLGCFRLERHQRRVPTLRWRLGFNAPVLCTATLTYLRMDMQLEHHDRPQRFLRPSLRSPQPVEACWKHLQFWRQHHRQEPTADHEHSGPVERGVAVRIDLSGRFRYQRHQRRVPALRRYLRLFGPGALHGHVDPLRMVVRLVHDGPRRFLRSRVGGVQLVGKRIQFGRRYHDHTPPYCLRRQRRGGHRHPDRHGNQHSRDPDHRPHQPL